VVDVTEKAAPHDATLGEMATATPAPAPRVLLVGGGPAAEAVRSAVAELGGTARVVEPSNELDDALADATLNVVVVDVGDDPGEILQLLQKERPDLPIVAIAHDASIEGAVSAMRQGAADVIEWPGPSEMLQEVLRRQLSRDPTRLDREYAERVDTARRQILERTFNVAIAQLRRTLTLDARRPEAFNLLGVLDDVRGHRIKAQRWWRMALLVDPAYAPAQHNLTRSTRRPAPPGPLSLG
jgi:DNA-binding response OmpR family regulator